MGIRRPTMRELLIENLARNQSFDSALRRGSFVDRLADEYLPAVMFTPDADRRSAAINAMQRRIVTHFDRVVQPEARQIGIANARAVLASTPPPSEGLADAAYRKRILYEGAANARDRVRIVQAMVNDRANTLENRLTAYWLEPGVAPKQKLDTLKALHEKMNAEQIAYNDRFAAFLRGEGSRPRQPNLDFMARFQNGVKTDVRVQARRAGTDAETQHFLVNGHTILAWVTVNASEACPDCKKRQGITGDDAFWKQTGKPGSGSTICGAACFCMLVPASTLNKNPDLRQNGLETRVKPVATPPSQVEAIEERREQQASPPPFPSSHAEAKSLRTVRRLGGSTGAELVEDSFGQKFVRKTGSSADHLREEFYAEEAYRAFGADVPDSKLFEAKGDRPIKISKFIEGGKTLGEIPAGLERELLFEKAQKHFAADALLANWDVAGVGYDNLMVDPAGKVWRIDTGGALRFRAQGGAKGAAFGDHPGELLSLRKRDVNEYSHGLYALMNHGNVVNSAKDALSREAAVLSALPPELRDKVAKRFASLADVVRSDTDLAADKWTIEYRERFFNARLHLRAAGWTDSLPKELKPIAGAASNHDLTRLVDEKGLQWDELRGLNSKSKTLMDEIDKFGGSSEFVAYWGRMQASDSWNEAPGAIKVLLARSRNVDPKQAFFWHKGVPGINGDPFDFYAERLARYESIVGAETLQKTIAIQHASTYELLVNTRLPHTDANKRFVSVIRTERRDVMQDAYNLKPGDKGVQMKRGAAESFSLTAEVRVDGDQPTIQSLPFHRVIGAYPIDRYRAPYRSSYTPGSMVDKSYMNDGMFMGDDENELVCMSEGFALDYEQDTRRNPRGFVWNK